MNYKRILVFRTGHLGDTIVTLPAFWAIRNSFPDAHITLLSNTNPGKPKYVLAQSVLPDEGLFDDWINYPTGVNKYQTLKMFTQTLLRIRRERFDVVVYLMNRIRTEKQIERDRVFFKVAGIKNIVGLNHLKQNILSFQIERPLPTVEAEYKYFLDALKFDKFPVPRADIINSDMLFTDEEIDFANSWIQANCGIENKTEKTLVGVGPGSKWESKVWMEDRFYEVINTLIREKNVFPIIFGGPEDKEKGDRLIKKWKVGANAAGKLNVRQAAAALKNCKFYLGNDTGTMHLAAAVGIQCVGIFAAIDFSGRWFPFGLENKIFRKQVECEGCHTSSCFNNNKCLDLITPDEVINACLEILI